MERTNVRTRNLEGRRQPFWRLFSTVHGSVGANFWILGVKKGNGEEMAQSGEKRGEKRRGGENAQKTGGKWARYGLKRVNKERKGGITWEGDVFHVQRLT